MILTKHMARYLTNKTLKRVEKEKQREINLLIAKLNADIKSTAKKGISDFRTRVRNMEICDEVKSYFVNKGFNCWEYTNGNTDLYLAIEW